MPELAERAHGNSTLRYSPAVTDEPVETSPGPLRVCSRFMTPMDAEIFAARLQAEGIAAQVMDANTVYSDGFAGGFGMGGIRVMVPEVADG